MPVFEARIQNVKVTLSPFSSSQMMTIAQVVRDHIVWRIQGVQDINDSWASPLTEQYKIDKANGRRVALSGSTRFRGLPIRNWTLRGRTLDAVRVKFASQDRATIGPTSQETGKIITGRNVKDKMWGMSPSDNQTMIAVVLETLRAGAVMRVEKMGFGKIKAA